MSHRLEPGQVHGILLLSVSWQKLIVSQTGKSNSQVKLLYCPEGKWMFALCRVLLCTSAYSGTCQWAHLYKMKNFEFEAFIVATTRSLCACVRVCVCGRGQSAHKRRKKKDVSNIFCCESEYPSGILLWLTVIQIFCCCCCTETCVCVSTTVKLELIYIFLFVLILSFAFDVFVILFTFVLKMTWNIFRPLTRRLLLWVPVLQQIGRTELRLIFYFLHPDRVQTVCLESGIGAISWQMLQSNSMLLFSNTFTFLLFSSISI